jgi:hypothetical protein
VKKENEMNKKLLVLLSILVMLAMACNLSSIPGGTQAPGAASQVPGNNPQGDQPATNPQPASTPPASPVSINDGLGSLNSYAMTITFKTLGPDPATSSSTVAAIEHSKDQDATHTNLNFSSTKADGSEPSNNTTDLYDIGNDRCSGSSDSWSWTSYTPDQAEMLGLFKSMLGLTPLIENPTFVGAEAVNGIPTNHFTFKVSGLGVKSGAEVKTNQGDYWLAVDGQYIVQYKLIVEEGTDPQNVLHSEVSIDLTQINQPVNISFPAGCITASQATPTP